MEGGEGGLWENGIESQRSEILNLIAENKLGQHSVDRPPSLLDCYKILVVGTRDGHRMGVYFRDCLAGEDLRHGRTPSLLWRGLHQLTWKTN